MRLFRKVNHPPICADTNHTCDETLDEKHPAPALQPTLAMEVVKGVIDNVARSQPEHFSRLHRSEAKLLLPPGIPHADEIGHRRIDSGHGNPQQHAQGDHLSPRVNECRAESNHTETERGGREPETWPDKSHGHSARKLKDHIDDGKYEDGDGVSCAVEIQVVEHGRDRG